MTKRRKTAFRIGERRKTESVLDNVKWRLKKKEKRSSKDRRKNK